MIDRRRACIAIAGGLLAAPIMLRAQSPGRIWRSGYLGGGSARALRFASFVGGMAELGYTVGRNLLIEEKYGGGRPNRFAEFAAELVRLPVEVIVVAGPGPLQAARESTRTIPIVMIPAVPTRSAKVSLQASRGRAATSPD